MFHIKFAFKMPYIQVLFIVTYLIYLKQVNEITPVIQDHGIGNVSFNVADLTYSIIHSLLLSCTFFWK